MSPDRPRLPKRGRTNLGTTTYIGGLVAAAVVLLAAAWALTGPPKDWGATITLALLASGGAIIRETEVGDRVRISFISIILVAAAAIVGPVGAGLVGAVGMSAKPGKSPLVVRSFNVAMMSLLGTLGGLIYWSLGGQQQFVATSPGEVLVHVGVPLIVIDIVHCLLNAVLIGVVLRLSSGAPIRASALKLLSTSGLAYIGYGVIGFLLVVLWLPAEVGWSASILVLAPLLVARWAFDQYGEEVNAHERTLRALVTAEEKKEPRNVGNSDRVAQLSEWMAQSIGLGHKEIQDIRIAGMLHDIGTVAVPSRLLRGQGPLTDDDLVEIAAHAPAGVRVVEGIGFLRGSLDGIAHHHERFDGHGYPAGLSGNEIPLAARIVAVAASFDALTTPRAYRPALTAAEALEVVTSRGGSQFDPMVCGALARVLARHDWDEERGEPAASSGAETVIHHDEPEFSDHLASRPDLVARVRASGGADHGAGPAGVLGEGVVV